MDRRIIIDAHNGMSLWEGYIISNTDYVDVRVNTGRHKVVVGQTSRSRLNWLHRFSKISGVRTMKDWDEAGVWRKDAEF